MKRLLGTGLLSWPSYERVAGRYGIVALFRPGIPEYGEAGLQGLLWNVDVEPLVDTHGSLLAVLDGQEYDLGSGTFFTEEAYGITYVGLRPDEPREEDWLNVDNLYKVDFMLCGYRNIDLYFVQDEVMQATAMTEQEATVENIVNCITLVNKLSVDQCRKAVQEVATTQPFPTYETARRLYLLLADGQSQHPLVKQFYTAYEHIPA